MGDIGNKTVKEIPQMCKQFFVVKKMENVRHRVFDSATNTLDPEILLDQLKVLTVSNVRLS